MKTPKLMVRKETSNGLKIVNMSIAGQKRLLRELELFKFTKEDGIKAQLAKETPDGPELLHLWDIYITGPADCLYEGHVLHAQMEFPERYPFTPPTFKFITPMFHPNIYQDGKVCISILRTENDDLALEEEDDKCTWTPGLNVSAVCISVMSLLTAPNIYSPANIDASKMFRDNLDLYGKTVRNMLEEAENKKQ